MYNKKTRDVLQMICILEVVMILATFMYSYLILYCRHSSFIFGIISSVIMTYILVKSNVYIQATLNVIYIMIYIYSYINWRKQKDNIKICNISSRGIILTAIFLITFTVIMGYTFDTIEATYPYLDAFSSSCSMTALFLLSKKVVESSYVFIMANIASIIICYITKDYAAIVTFFIYMIFNIIRIFTWKKIKAKESMAS